MSKDFWDRITKEKFSDWNGPDAKRYWEGESSNLLIPKDSIIVGENEKDFSKAYLSLDAFDTHIQLLGASRTGKSYFLEGLSRDFMLRGCGGCLITPHAEIYNHMENFISHFPELAKKVVFFNPAQIADRYVGFNPLKKSKYYPVTSVHIDQIVDCSLAVWRDDPEVAKKVIQWLTNMLWCLIEGGMTLPDAISFLKNPEKRNQLVGLTNNDFVLSEWQTFERLSHRDKEDAFSSLKRRLPRFSTSPSVWYTIGRTENVLDIEDIVENQKIVLCNFSGQKNLISSEDAYLLGTLFINEIVNYCKAQRTESKIAKEKPFFMVIDEAHQFLSMKISEALAECAKNGLHMVIATQNLSQLREYSEILFQNVMQNARTKIIFGGLSAGDLELLEKDLFSGDHDYKKIKEEIYRTTVVGYSEETRVVEGGSKALGSAESLTSSEGEAVGSGSANMSSSSFHPAEGFWGAAVYNFDEPNSMTKAESSIESGSNMSSRSSAQASVSSESESWNKVPILIPIFDKELASRQYYNLEELREMNRALLKNVPKQHCFIKVSDKPIQHVFVKNIIDFERDPEKIKEILRISYEQQAKYYLSVNEIENILKKREKNLKIGSELKEPDDFREPRKL
jgi:hypothetical protein